MASLALSRTCFKIFTAISCDRKQRLWRAQSRMALNTSRENWTRVVWSYFSSNRMASCWARWRLKSPVLRLFTRPFIQGAGRRKHQGPTSLAFVRGIHRWPINFLHKRPVTRKMFPFDDIIMCTRCETCHCEMDSFSVFGLMRVILRHENAFVFLPSKYFLISESSNQGFDYYVTEACYESSGFIIKYWLRSRCFGKLIT